MPTIHPNIRQAKRNYKLLTFLIYVICFFVENNHKYTITKCRMCPPFLFLMAGLRHLNNASVYHIKFHKLCIISFFSSLHIQCKIYDNNAKYHKRKKIHFNKNMRKTSQIIPLKGKVQKYFCSHIHTQWRYKFYLREM